MKIAICFFSGTGNTAYAAAQLSDHFTSLGHSVELCTMEQGDPVQASDADLLMLGGPIYAGNVPEAFIRWVLRKIPSAKPGARAALFSTSAGLLNANGIRSLAVKAVKKGYTVVGSFTFVMPRNFYFGSYAPMEPELIRDILKKTTREIGEAAALLCGEPQPEEISAKGILALDLTAELMSVMARFMGKQYSADENCIRCRKCEKNCPTGNIKLLQSKVQFGLSCMLCTRCIHGCPTHAIRYGKKLYPQYRINEITKWNLE